MVPHQQGRTDGAAERNCVLQLRTLLSFLLLVDQSRKTKELGVVPLGSSLQAGQGEVPLLEELPMPRPAKRERIKNSRNARRKI